jgi:hypothetical protein
MKAIYDSQEIAEFCKTHSPQEAERHFKCSRSTVSNACRAYDVTPMSRPNQKRKEMADWAKETGATIEHFCKQWKCSRSRASYIYREFDIPIKYDRTPSTMVAPTQFEVLALLLQGHRQCEIADTLFVSRQRVEQIQRLAEKHRLLGPEAIVQPVSKGDTES